MGVQSYDKKTTGWIGIWYHPESNSYSSAALNLKVFKDFKGTVRFYLRKNRFYQKGTNRPNFVLAISDSKAERFIQQIEVIDDEWDREEWRKLYTRNGSYFDDGNNRFYSEDEVRTIIDGVIRDVQNGYTDLIADDYV